MNKIIIGKKIICDSNAVKVNGKTIELNTGDYELEYANSGEYNLKLIINGNVNLLVYSFDNDITSNLKYIINDGSLHIYKFYNNYSVNETIDIDLLTSKAMVEYKFANICKENEKYLLNVNHIAEDTISNINNKTVSFPNSSINFIINSNVSKEAVGSKLNQTTRIVTMGDCDASISPNMYTPLDDVEAKHGSVIGTFKEDEVFYLMSKGISYNDTLKLMIKGYLLSNIDIKHEIRKKIIDVINEYWG